MPHATEKTRQTDNTFSTNRGDVSSLGSVLHHGDRHDTVHWEDGIVWLARLVQQRPGPSG